MRVGRWLAWSAGAVAVMLVGAVLWLWPRCSGEGCPSVEALRDYTPPQASQVFDSDGQVLAHLAPERRIVIPIQQMPAHVAGAFLAIEDRRFFEHSGVDYRRVVGAALRDVQTLSFSQGFSTITMQLARNVFPEHLTRAKTLKRKAWEVVLARQMEKEFSKQQILEMYLNQIYLGNGLYGVEAAAQGYFGKSTSELNVPEAALLAAIPKAPTTYNPRQQPLNAVRRRNLVLAQMAKAGVISTGESEEASAEPLELVPPSEARGSAPYFVAAVRKQLQDQFGEGAENAGLRVFTGLDRQMQSAAANALREQLARVESGELGRFRGPHCSTEKADDPSACLQGMFVALDNQTGDVMALVGGRDFAASQFDRATQAQRQAGSAFKPFLYAAALGAGIPINTPLLGPGAADYEGGYVPADHVETGGAPIDLREALRLSSNLAAVALGERVGVENVVETARHMGISTPIEAYPSTLLGAFEVIPIEMVSAFTAFARGGDRVAPRFIQRVEDANGQVLWESEVLRLPALSPEVAFLTTSLMQDVVDRGTGSSVRSSLPGYVPAAGKTGTTNEAADAWFVGFTPDVTAGVWVGFDKRERITVGGGGGSIAAPVWGRVMADYYQTHDAPPPWMPPLGVATIRLDRESGQLATSACPENNIVLEWFLEGTEPTEYCHLHPAPGLENWLRRGIRGIEEVFGRRRGN